MNAKVEAYIESKSLWIKELQEIRKTLLSFPLEETIKWGAPTYVYKNKNVVGLAAFKNYCGLWFFQGALLKDTYKVLINAQENKTKVMLQWRFASIDEINTSLIKEYLQEAMQNIDNHIELKPQKDTSPITIPAELQEEFDINPTLKINFEKFSLSCKREFTSYVAEAKKTETRLRRIEKIKPMIERGEGLNDQYKN